jgi:hypothetical protein
MKLKQNEYVKNATKTTHGKLVKSSLQEQGLEREVFQVSL